MLLLRMFLRQQARGFYPSLCADATIELLRYSERIKTCNCPTSLSVALQKHHDKYLHLMDDLRLPGCYGMTELGHGSNVMGIETTAEYDSSTQEFVINTPNDDASKFWIGGAAQHGKVCLRSIRPPKRMHVHVAAVHTPVSKVSVGFPFYAALHPSLGISRSQASKFFELV
jgi:alkylation response protein AidB-like acyl-CoA dehydrogenase